MDIIYNKDCIEVLKGLGYYDIACKRIETLDK